MTLQRKKLFKKSLAIFLCCICLIGALSEHSFVAAAESTIVDSAYAESDKHYTWDNSFGFQANGNATELTYLYQNSDTGLMDDDKDGTADYRFADSKETWTYYFKFEDTLSSLFLDITVEGQRLVDVSVDGTQWQNVAVDWDWNDKEDTRINLSSIVSGKTDDLYIRFSDSSQWEGHGTGLWSLYMQFDLENGAKNTVPSGPSTNIMVENVFEMATAGSEQEQSYLLESQGAPTNGDHRFADENNYWIYYFRFLEPLDKAILTMDISGEYKVSASVDGVDWVTVAEVSEYAARSELEVDLKQFGMMFDGNQILYLKFSDSDVSDGFGPALYNVGFKYILSSGVVDAGPCPFTLNCFSFDMNKQTKLEKTADTMYMLENNGTNLYESDTEASYRFADELTYWVYGFSFFDELRSAQIRLNVGNQYHISVSDDGEDWKEMAVATETSGFNWIEIDLNTFLEDKDVTHLYVKFADSVITDGFGVKLSEIQLDYILRNGLPDTAPMPISSTLYAPIETWDATSASLSAEGTMDNYYLSETEYGAFSLECDLDMSSSATLTETTAASIVFGMREAGAAGYSFAMQRNYDGTIAVRLFKVPHRDQDDEGNAVDEIYYRNDVDELYTGLLNNVDITGTHKLKVTRHMGKIELFLDGELLKTVYDNEFTSGHIGFGVFNGSAEFVNIRVQDSTGIGVSISGDQQIGLGKETTVVSAIEKNNTISENTPILWTVSGENAQFASIDSNGVFKATKSGYYDVTASLDTVRSEKLRIAVGIWVEGVTFDKIYYEPTTVSFINKGVATLDDAAFAQGDTVSATGDYELEVTHEEDEDYLAVNFSVVIYGDVTGDGKINVEDHKGMQNHFIDSNCLEGVYWKAADASTNNIVDTRDLIAIKKKITASTVEHKLNFEAITDTESTFLLENYNTDDNSDSEGTHRFIATQDAYFTYGIDVGSQMKTADINVKAGQIYQKIEVSFDRVTWNTLLNTGNNSGVQNYTYDLTSVSGFSGNTGKVYVRFSGGDGYTGSFGITVYDFGFTYELVTESLYKEPTGIE